MPGQAVRTKVTHKRAPHLHRNDSLVAHALHGGSDEITDLGFTERLTREKDKEKKWLKNEADISRKTDNKKGDEMPAWGWYSGAESEPGGNLTRKHFANAGPMVNTVVYGHT